MNMMPTFTSPTKVGKVWRFMGLEVEIILASASENSAPIYTVRLRYPRIIHGEVMTHRVFNRNARSSRAVPVMTMLAELRSGTILGMFTPWHWGKNQKGMQAVEECCEKVGTRSYTGMSREEAWGEACDQACEIAEGFHNAGYHKQVVNRITEPFSYIDVLITATDWANFFHLRDHADAEPHLRDLARLVKLAFEDEDLEMQWLEPGDWHLPYVTNLDRHEWLYGDGVTIQALLDELDNSCLEGLKRVSAARCAWISYKPFGEGSTDGTYEREMKTYEMLVGNGAIHATPLEHQATPDTMSYYKLIRLENDIEEMVEEGYDWDNPHLQSNLRGWVQNRKTVPNECVWDA
jgi:hypothetical protein